MKKEIERKFWIDYENIPFDKISYSNIISQFYVNITPENRFRHLANDNIYKHTVKSPGGLIRGEDEFEIGFDFFKRAEKIRIGDILEKKRSYIYLSDGLCVELDIHLLTRLKGLIIAEVEFKTKENALKFKPLEWFGKEITDLKMFKTATLATNTNITYLFLKQAIS